MKIALSLLSGVSYGGVTYFKNLLPELVASGGDHEFHFFVSKGYFLKEELESDKVFFHEVLRSNKSALKRFLYEQIILPIRLWRDGIDIVFTAKNMNIFFAPCKTVIAIRNVEPFVYQDYKNSLQLNIQSWLKWQLTKVSVRKAERIVAVSSGVRERVAKRFPEAIGKVSVVYNGNPVRIPPEPTRENFVLSASKFVAYANQLSLIHGYAKLVERRPETPPLLFAGGIHDQGYFDSVLEAVKEHDLDSRVRFLGLIPQKELFKMYAQARAFIFPSTLEACPHTLIEVMSCNTPIATSTHQPMPEICEEGAVYFEAFDTNSIADALERVIFDEDSRVSIVQAASQRHPRFTYTDTAKQMNELFSELLTDN
jgi:glycosyltransferase involved in cell wall biosynthesis